MDRISVSWVGSNFASAKIWANSVAVAPEPEKGCILDHYFVLFVEFQLVVVAELLSVSTLVILIDGDVMEVVASSHLSHLLPI